MKRSDFKDEEVFVLPEFNGTTYYIKKDISYSREKYISSKFKSVQNANFSESYSVPYRHATELETNYLNYCIDKNKWMSLEDFKKIQIPIYEIY